MSTLREIHRALNIHANKTKAESLSRFFKTGTGQYGEGDKFLGIVVPHIRTIAKKYRDLPLNDIQTLLDSNYHEHRMLGLYILVYQYEKADEKMQTKLYTFYIKNVKAVNNWDLVDTTTPNIMGHYLYHHPDKKKILYKLVTSKKLWERRIAILATYYLIRKENFEDTLELSKILLHDAHDLIHKAVGWMLREVGKRDIKTEVTFLKKHYKTMPRTMLRYAIEKFPREMREDFMKK